MVHNKPKLANRYKFQIKVIQRNFWNPIEETDEFHIRDTDTTPEHMVKRLGVLLDNKLSFIEHISQVCCKASHQLNILRRIRSFFEEPTRLLIYKCFIKSHFYYCSFVWYHCGIGIFKMLRRGVYAFMKNNSQSINIRLVEVSFQTSEHKRLFNIKVLQFTMDIVV